MRAGEALAAGKAEHRSGPHASTVAAEPHPVAEIVCGSKADADARWAVSMWVDSEVRYLGAVRLAHLPIAEGDTIRGGVSRRASFLIGRSDLRVARIGERTVGFAVVDLDTPVVHYVYVVQSERHRGIGTRLIRDVVKSAPWAFTHKTGPGSKFAAAVSKMAGYFAGRFDPYILDRLEEGDH